MNVTWHRLGDDDVSAVANALSIETYSEQTAIVEDTEITIYSDRDGVQWYLMIDGNGPDKLISHDETSARAEALATFTSE